MASPVGFAVSVIVLPVEVAVSQLTLVVTAMAGLAPEAPGNAPFVSLKITGCDAGTEPLVEVNNVLAGLASSTWFPADVTSSEMFTLVAPLGVVTVTTAV